MSGADSETKPGAGRALALLLVINLFCYLDRNVLASIVPAIKAEFLAGDPDANGKAGLLSTAFLFSYMFCAPLFGLLADRFSRWLLIGFSVAGWSLACGASGLAGSFAGLLLTRVFLGVGEAGYGPAAPTIISDLFPVEKRGTKLAWFYMAIPVGSALGYALGGFVAAHLGWRWAFYVVAPPGILLAILCLFMPEPRTLGRRTGLPLSETGRGADTPVRGGGDAMAPAGRDRPRIAEYRRLLRIPSLTLNILAQTAMTFAIGGMAFWMPTYIHEARGQPLDRSNLLFGAILVVAGLVSTLAGGWLSDRLRARLPGSYFLVSGSGMLLAFPCVIAMLYAPFPAAWAFIFLAVFFSFLNTGPCNTALANVAPSSMRATAFAMNILVIHLFGDAFSPALIGWIKDRSTWTLGFLVVSAAMLVAGMIWLAGAKTYVRDSRAMEQP